jgi:asparagine synthase (glutamine-hydrolysing)
VQQSFSVFSYGLYKAASGQNTDVLLSGFGGDEMVSARVAVSWNELISKREWDVIRDELYYNGIRFKSVIKPVRIAARYVKSRLLKPGFRTGVFTPELIAKRFENLPLQQEFAIQHELRRRIAEKYRIPFMDNLSDKQKYRINLNHVSQRMEYCYTAAAQFGIEYRYPLLDVNLILAGMAFPPWMKQHHGTNRYIFRQAMKGFVPERIRTREDKSGSTIPHTYFSLHRDRQSILDLVQKASSSSYLNTIFVLDRFSSWYQQLVGHNREELNYLNPGAFYQYLMMLLFYGSDE